MELSKHGASHCHRTVQRPPCIRHGTTTWFTALDYHHGRLISCIERQRRHQERLEILKKSSRETPKRLKMHLSVDDYSTLNTES